MLNANIARSGVLSVHELSRFATARIWFITYSGAFAVYFRPDRRAFDSLSAPAPENLPSIRKKSQIPGGQPRWGGGGRAQLELTDAQRTKLWLGKEQQLDIDARLCKTRHGMLNLDAEKYWN